MNTELPPAGIVIVSGKMFQLVPTVIFASTSNGVVRLFLTVIGITVVEPVITFIRFTTSMLGSIASTPVPCNEYTVGDPVALCVNVKSAALSPSVVGVYVTSNT